ncbi:MAG: bifunctional aspartate kinase/homoserine dehydrogenase I [Flavobacteriaceae bacterium]
MKVLKFGGTSVANNISINKVIEIVSKQSDKSVVVVSALGGVTDLLDLIMNKALKNDKSFSLELDIIKKRHIELIKKSIKIVNQSKTISFLKNELNKLEVTLDGILVLNELTSKTISKILSFGEVLSSKIIYEIFKENNLDVQLIDSRKIITTNKRNNKDIVDWNKTEKKTLSIFKTLKSKITILPGFISSNSNGDLTTLGRGGSDYTASIIANILNAKVLEIWTDVSGMYTANPKIVSQATPIDKLTYFEAMELSHFGAKVIFPPTLQPLVEKNIPVKIKNTFQPKDEGTLINSKSSSKNKQVVKGISHIDDISLISLEGSGMIGIPGFSKRLFEVLLKENINVIMITQASSEQSICIGVKQIDAYIAKNAIDNEFEFEISQKKVSPTVVENGLVNIAMVGEKMKDHQGISGKMFSSLGKNNVNIRAIAQGASERNISIIIKKRDCKKALNTLHERFFEENIKELNLFIIGVGNVGSKLLEQIENQTNYLRENLKLRIRVIALSNSKNMILGTNPILIKNWKKSLKNSEKTDIERFYKHAKKLNYRNSIFVDNTASSIISLEYEKYLNSNIGVVTCNKIACADTLKNYLNLKNLSRKFGSPFLFETNVGAGLPIIDTLNNLIASGDQVNEIKAVLSGSLNFIFNNFSLHNPFHKIVLKAQEEGYTEPDPKIDLSGIDVARKILILARESGLKIELNEIEISPFLPKKSLKTSNNNEFFQSLIEHEDYFNKILKNANENDSKLKYVASLKNGKAKVGLEEIPKGHNFYDLEGSDNIVLFYTNRYSNQPLIVKGAGAGAEVTASGIFADIIRIGKR